MTPNCNSRMTYTLEPGVVLLTVMTASQISPMGKLWIQYIRWIAIEEYTGYQPQASTCTNTYVHTHTLWLRVQMSKEGS